MERIVRQLAGFTLPADIDARATRATFLVDTSTARNRRDWSRTVAQSGAEWRIVDVIGDSLGKAERRAIRKGEAVYPERIAYSVFGLDGDLEQLTTLDCVVSVEFAHNGLPGFNHKLGKPIFPTTAKPPKAKPFHEKWSRHGNTLELNGADRPAQIESSTVDASSIHPPVYPFPLCDDGEGI